MITLENDNLCIRIDSKGAQLDSVFNKKNDIEYLWQGDPDFWGRKSPVLFPIVGKLTDNECIIDDKTYYMTQHGFARDMDFMVTENTDTDVTYELVYDGTTLDKYPYKFKLIIKYTLEANRLTINYIVENMDSRQIYFSIGAHPGFNCPLTKGETLEDYYLEFNQPETLGTYYINEAGYIATQPKPYLDNDSIINLDCDIFNNDALIFKDTKSTSISLKSKKSTSSITMDYSGFPYIGIWGKQGRTPFVCLEPWYGINDFENSNKMYDQKIGVESLMPKEIFKSAFSLTIE